MPLTSLRFRALLLAVVAGSILGLFPRASLADHEDPILKSIRERLHHTSAYVPPFPMDDRPYFKTRNWPDTLTVAGRRTVRRIRAAGPGPTSVFVKTLREVRPGMRVTLFYDPESQESLPTKGWGPWYSWDERNRLREKIWYEPDSARLVTHDYTYYKSGRLLGYSWRSEARNQSASDVSYEYLSEFYDPEGRLLAVAHERKETSGTTSIFTWKGEPVSYDEFRMKTHVLFAEAR
jgi:hypothetical protein